VAQPPWLRRKLRQRQRRWRRHGGLRRLPERSAHALRWRLSNPEAIARWTDGELDLDGYYWLFVLGLNNSGTSLVSRVLASHPRIRSLPGEGQLLTRALPQAVAYGARRNWTARLDVFHWTEENDPAPALRVRYDWASYYERGPGVLLEKSPPNTVRARWLQANFRPSRFIGVIRHPYAVCEGIRRREGLSIAEAALHWSRGNGIMLDDADRLERFLLVTYESFATQPQGELERIEAFLELDEPFDRRVLDQPLPFHNVDGKVQRLTNLNEKSLKRLAPEEIETIDEIAGPLMERLGYERA
jgi:hypothetical protein